MAIERPQGVHSPEAARRPRSFTVMALSFLAGALVAILGLFLIVRASQGLAGTVGSWLQRTTHTDMSQPTVVDRIQKLQRLETVVYTMDKIVTGEKGSAILPDFLAGDRLLLMVHGEVIAGIDFQMLKASDVTVNGKKVRMKIPQAQVLVTRLDSSKTRVYSRQTGLLVPTDPNLESQVRDDAERELRRSALADGILQKAQENARATMMSLIRSMGFEEVEFE
ncbi:MAG: DUF4230 domain-containing protein [Acidobacteria bacterium]|nr:DUF4230 domain-containing protein [Acidobacteriota bacterium]